MKRVILAMMLVFGGTVVGCAPKTPSLSISSIEYAETCYVQTSAPAQIREGIAELYTVSYETLRINETPKLQAEGAVGLIEVPNKGYLLYGKSLGPGKLVATVRDEDNATRTATFDINVVPQSTAFPASTCVKTADAGTAESDAGPKATADAGSPDGG